MKRVVALEKDSKIDSCKDDPDFSHRLVSNYTFDEVEALTEEIEEEGQTLEEVRWIKELLSHHQDESDNILFESLRRLQLMELTVDVLKVPFQVCRQIPELSLSSGNYIAGVCNELGLMGARAASTQAVRSRMKSVKNIQKITKAMKMVASSKLRGVQNKTINSRGLWQPFTALLGDAPSVDVKKNVIVVITSDKGLCGGINSTSAKVSKFLYKLTSGPEKDTKFVVLGDKGKVLLVREFNNSIELTVSGLQKLPLNYTQISVLADDILKNVEYDALRIVYNKFQSVMSFLPSVSTILSPETAEKESEAGGILGELDSYEIEGGETKAEILQNLAEFQFSCLLYNAAMENACSELGARMSSMDNSSKNAGEMLDRLTLSYNRTRQASITTELSEIISGAAALTG
ncbi:hypothetical protein ZIOFF_049064 [Zingiber officinale]|uniref:F-ATPase gamma subunit n=1 Tax=Zingiber officinale TaxID=94328 RepID=A0A8J5G0F1_ZINOF|nr:hypothetical protein ZIOFF_049064 [Zingiber officinale]